MKCPNCGNETNGKFCEKCGTPLVQNNSHEGENGFDSFNQTQQQSYDSYNQPYNSGQQYNQGGFEQPQSPNQTSYGQQFTNQNSGYNGTQQFTNDPNGQMKSNKKTAIIITSVIGGIVVLILVIAIIILCNLLPTLFKYIKEESDKSYDSSSSQSSKQVDYDDDFLFDDDYDDGDNYTYYIDESSCLYYEESDSYDGWKITGFDYEDIPSDKKLTIKLPETIDGKNVVEIDDLMVAVPETKVKVVIPKTVKYIGMLAFSFSDDIYEIEIADGVKTIERDAFLSLPNLKSITIPDSVTKMDDCGLGIDTDENSEKVPVEGFKMYCKKGSAAEKYAQDNNLSYEIIK